MKNEAHYWFDRLKMLGVWVLDLESTNIILKNECEGPVVYAQVLS